MVISQNARPPIAIIGAGVSGLTVGCWLAKLGYTVRIWTRSGDDALVSTKAGAVWLPFQAKPQDLVNRLALETLEDLVQFSKIFPQSGVSMPLVRFYFSQGTLSSRLPDHPLIPCKEIAQEHLPQNFKKGFNVVLPFVDTTLFMPFLKSLFLELGGTLHTKTLDSLDQVPMDFPFLVNCSGLGAKELVNDNSVFPIRGQTIKVKPWRADAYYIDDSDENFPAYIFTRAHDCLLGGTAQAHQSEEHPQPGDTQSILERCARMAPEVRKAEILSEDVGLRPGRNALRLECDAKDSDGRTVIHNYGHGGSGFTIGFGCARRVVSWIQGHGDRSTVLPLPF